MAVLYRLSFNRTGLTASLNWNTAFFFSFITDIPASSSDIPDYFLPVAEFKVTQCSTFAVVCRLKSNDFLLTSEAKVLSFPEHPLFNISIPKNAVQKGEEHHIIVKVS